MKHILKGGFHDGHVVDADIYDEGQVINMQLPIDDIPVAMIGKDFKAQDIMIHTERYVAVSRCDGRGCWLELHIELGK